MYETWILFSNIVAYIFSLVYSGVAARGKWIHRAYVNDCALTSYVCPSHVVLASKI